MTDRGQACGPASWLMRLSVQARYQLGDDDPALPMVGRDDRASFGPRRHQTRLDLRKHFVRIGNDLGFDLSNGPHAIIHMFDESDQKAVVGPRCED